MRGVSNKHCLLTFFIVAEQTGLSLTFVGTPKTGFLLTRPIWLYSTYYITGTLEGETGARETTGFADCPGR